MTLLYTSMKVEDFNAVDIAICVAIGVILITLVLVTMDLERKPR